MAYGTIYDSQMEDPQRKIPYGIDPQSQYGVGQQIPQEAQPMDIQNPQTGGVDQQTQAAQAYQQLQQQIAQAQAGGDPGHHMITWRSILGSS